MKAKTIMRFIGNGLLSIFTLVVFISLVMALGVVATILLAMLGYLIGIDMGIFIYFALFCISWKVWDALTWIVGKIADRIERKKEREYFERLNKGQ